VQTSRKKIRRENRIPGNSAWCGGTNVPVTDDHIFPRAIGGTKELTVPACQHCQTIFSRAETDFARRSLYALYTVDSGPRGRDKRKPQSGVIQPVYLLVPHPLGGYCESGMRAGGGVPEALPYIEIDVKGGRGGRARGARPQDVDRLVEAARSIFRHRPDESGLIGRISVRTDDLGEIAKDDDFWPRIVLDLAGKLFIRSRDPAEARNFVALFAHALEIGAFRDHSSWTSCEIVGGTIHTAAMRYRSTAAIRVVAKIACGLMFLRLGYDGPETETHRKARAIVNPEEPDAPAISAKLISEPGTLRFWPDYHVGLVEACEGRLRSVVSLYGDCHTVDMGTIPNLDEFESIVAFCRKDGTRAFLVEGEESAKVADVLNRYITERVAYGVHQS
jgi:hypothetical protein